MRLAVVSLILCTFFLGCTHAPMSNSVLQRVEPQHVNKPAITLRHEGILTIGKKNIYILGILKTAPETGHANVAILDRFGIKVATFQLTHDKIKAVHKGPLGAMIPHFMEQAEAIARTIFPPLSQVEKEMHVEYEGTITGGGYSFAKRITITQQKLGYTLILQLKGLQVHDQK